MKSQLQYGATAKVLHWVVVTLLVTQYLIGWLMPDIRRGMTPGGPMTMHISIGLVILALIVLRFLWRLTHPVAPESTLPAWQRVSSEGVHWLLYALVLTTTLTGWFFASMRGWTISFFFAVPLPMLTAGDSALGRAIGRWHETAEWTLLIVVGIHVAAALVHLLIHRDRVMQRMLPG
jgi:cytochrome b561